MLSTSDLRKWFLRNTKRGQAKHLLQFNREFATLAFLRAVGLKHRAFYKWLHGIEEQPRYMLQRMSRFVEDWEAGHLAFSKGGQNVTRELVHLEEPRKMPIKLAVDLSGRAARLRFIAKPKFERMPEFPDLAGPLSLDAEAK